MGVSVHFSLLVLAVVLINHIQNLIKKLIFFQFSIKDIMSWNTPQVLHQETPKMDRDGCSRELILCYYYYICYYILHLSYHHMVPISLHYAQKVSNNFLVYLQLEDQNHRSEILFMCKEQWSGLEYLSFWKLKESIKPQRNATVTISSIFYH